MTKDESKMWQTLKQKLNKYPIFAYRIENRTGKVPDIYFATSKNNGWIELKIGIFRPKNNTIKIKFEPGQLAWIRNHIKYNDNVYLITKIKDSYAWFINRGKNIQEIYHVDSVDFISINKILNILLYYKCWH